MKTFSNLKKLFSLYWVENKRMLGLFSLALFFFNVVIETLFYFPWKEHEVKVFSPIAFTFSIFFLIYHRKTIAMPTNRYSDMMLPVRAIDKWIVNVLVSVFLNFILCSVVTFLGQLFSGYLISFLKGEGGENVNIILTTLKYEYLINEMGLVIWMISIIIFASLKMSFGNSFPNMVERNWKAILIIFLSYALLWHSIGGFLMFGYSVDVLLIRGANNAIIGVCFIIANYFVIKRKELK